MSKLEQHQQLLAIIKDAISRDKELRDKYGIGEKFRFVRDRLQSLAEKLEQSLQEIATRENKTVAEKPKDEMLVYVYLFNAQGVDLRSWMKMLTPKIFYEHSVNRPVYLEQSHIEAFIRSRKNKVQNAYLTVWIKQSDILQKEGVKDVIDQPIAKIRESSLRFESLVSFTHNEHVYVVNEEGELIRKI